MNPTPFTRERLETISHCAEARRRSGGSHRDEMERDAALICSKWMEINGIDAIDHVGPFSAIEFQKGMTVKVRRGARVFSTDPAFPSEGMISARAQTVKVHSVSSGYIDYSMPVRMEVLDKMTDLDYAVRQGRITWVGSGSYYRWVDPNDVEVIERG